MKLRHKAVCIFCLALGVSFWTLFKNASSRHLQESDREIKQLFRSGYLRNGDRDKTNIKDSDIHPIMEDFASNGEEDSSSEPLYKNYNTTKPRHVTLKDSKEAYFRSFGEIRCLIQGTLNASSTHCMCKKGWHGKWCSIPDIVDEKTFEDPKKLKLRDGPPRRIIYGITFNIEFEMLEIRLAEVGDLIDAIIIVESNYTGSGSKKDLHLLKKLRSGFLHQYQQKIVHLFLDFFPTNGNPKDGKYTDFFIKSYPSKYGLRYVNGTRKDDLFIFADADEIHRREALLFLKLHDGYPEPFGIRMKRHCFGFFWNTGESLLGIGCSLEMLETVYDNKCGDLRGATSEEHLFTRDLKKYKSAGNYVQMWQIGKSIPPKYTGGWHCSWCFEPERIRTKLVSSFLYDFPRWGDYPEKLELDYIRDLIKVGLWFDESITFKHQYIGLDTPYAPEYVLKNPSKYKRLIFNPYRPL